VTAPTARVSYGHLVQPVHAWERASIQDTYSYCMAIGDINSVSRGTSHADRLELATEYANRGLLQSPQEVIDMMLKEPPAPPPYWANADGTDLQRIMEQKLANHRDAMGEALSMWLDDDDED